MGRRAALGLGAVAAAMLVALVGASAGRAHDASQPAGTIVYQFGSTLRAMSPDGSGDHQIGASGSGYDYGVPTISPDGTQIAVQNRNASSQEGIWVLNSDGTDFHQVVASVAADAHPEWSPDGTRISYESGGAIYVVNEDGSDNHLVYDPGDGSSGHWPTWTPDGQSLVFAMRYEVTTGDPSQVYDAVESGAPWDGYPWRFWQVSRPASTRTCSHLDGDINYRLPPEFLDQTCYLTPIEQLYTVPVTGGAPSLLTQPQQFANGETDVTHWNHVFSDIHSLRLSHSTGQIVFLAGSPRGPTGDPLPLAWYIQIVDATSGSVTRLLGLSPDANSYVSFSPDDTQILYDCDATLTCGLHVVNVDGSGDRQVPNTTISDGNNDWGVLNPPGPSRTPLIFVPGIEGTELYRGDSQVWPNAQGAYDNLSGDHFLDALSLAPDGTPLDGGTQLSTGDLVGHIDVDSHFGKALSWLPWDIPLGWAPFLGNKEIEFGCVGWPPGCEPGETIHATQDEYNATLSHLEGAGYVLNKTLFAFPYDWRRSDSDGGALLAGEIRAVLQQTHAKTVDILAHSQGGLVTLAMLHDEPAIASSVHRVVTLGTPVLGAPKTLGVMDFHDPCIIDPAPLVGCVYDSGTIASVTKTLPSAYELLPSQTLQQLDGSPLVVNGEPQPYGTWTANVAGGEGSPALVEAAESLHSGLDGFTPAVPVVRLYGSGHDTIRQIDDEDVQYCEPAWSQPCSIEGVVSLVYGDGDGTVPTSSASVPGTPDVAAIDVGNVKHMDLATDSGVLDQALEFLGAKTSAPERSFAPMASGLNGEDVEASGDVSLLVTDGVGRRTGADTRIPAQSSVEEIPGMSFEQVGDTGSAFFEDQGAYDTVATATGAGPVRIIVRPYAAGAITGQASFYVPEVEIGGTLRVIGAGDGTALADIRLAVDVDGDGTVDETLAPYVASGTTATDGVPPTTVGGANLSASGMSTVTLAADDGSGSGVAATWYELDGATQPTLYTGPFDAPLGSTVRFRSIDNAGNLEDVRSLVVDDVSDERTLAQPVGAPPPLRRRVDSASDVDWFTFVADGSSTYDVAVESPAGVTVVVYDGGGTRIASAASKPGAKKVSVTPDAGRCYIRIGPEGGAVTPIAYNVDVKTR